MTERIDPMTPNQAAMGVEYYGVSCGEGTLSLVTNNLWEPLLWDPIQAWAEQLVTELQNALDIRFAVNWPTDWSL